MTIMIYVKHYAMTIELLHYWGSFTGNPLQYVPNQTYNFKKVYSFIFRFPFFLYTASIIICHFLITFRII